MEDKQNVHFLYKKLGETPLECVERFRNEHPEIGTISMTYAGRLDPMAEGLLVVLSGNSIYEKERFLGLPKTYVFKILWGFETDTLDVLGLVSKTTTIVPLSDEVSVQSRTIGKIDQKYPAFSSKPVSGRPLFVWAREGKLGEIEIPHHVVEVFESKYLGRRNVSKQQLQEDIAGKISSVSGDFRQVESRAVWQEKLANSEADIFTIDTFEMTVSSGFYIRQFVSDLAEKLGSCATTFHIKRTRVGNYSLE